MNEYFSDLVFEISLKVNKCRPLDIAMLFEHKSAPDKNVLIQSGYYIMAHYHKCVVNKIPLKPVIPLVYYQGKRKWKIPKLSDIFKEYPEDIKEFLPEINHLFVALQSIPNETLYKIKNTKMTVFLLAQKNRNNPITLVEDFIKIMSLFQNELEERNFFQQTFAYMYNTSLVEPEEVIKIIESIPEPIKEDAMTTYSLLTKKYKQEGRQEGEQIGIQKEKMEVIIASFDDCLPISQIARIIKLHEDEVMEILRENGKIQ